MVSGKSFLYSIADNSPTQWAETLGTGFGPTSDWLIVPGWDRAETGHPAELVQKPGQTQKAPSEQRQARQSQLSSIGKLRPREPKHLAQVLPTQAEGDSQDPRAPISFLCPQVSLAKLPSSPTRAVRCVALCGTVESLPLLVGLAILREQQLCLEGPGSDTLTKEPKPRSNTSIFAQRGQVGSLRSQGKAAIC